MTTDNPRIAAYVPRAIYDRLKEFKDDRKLKSESQAITVALSEFFGVSREVDYQSSSDLVQRVEALEEKFSHLKTELLGELKSELLRLLSSTVKTELPSESQGELFKAALMPDEVEPEASEEIKIETSDSNSRLLSEPLTASDLSRYFGLNRNAVSQARHKYKNNPKELNQWFQDHDPNSLNWEYREDTKLYYPISSS